MEPVSIIIGVYAAVMASISAFADGKRLWLKWREKRRAKNLMARSGFRSLPGLDMDSFNEPAYVGLDSKLAESPRRIRSEYSRLSSVAGPLFNKGDSISAQQLSGGLARFQQSLVQKIRTSITTIAALDLNIAGMMTETEMIRNGHVSAFTGLFQRVLVARPLPRAVLVIPLTERYDTGDT